MIIAGLAVERQRLPHGFRSPLEPAELNLYGSTIVGEGPADLTLVGAMSGPVRGSLVLDSDDRGFTFVRTGGVLAADTYTLALRPGGLMDPALLTLQGVGLASGIAGNLTLRSIDNAAGLARIKVENLSGLTDASTILLNLEASVPRDAPYASKHVLDIQSLSINGGAICLCSQQPRLYAAAERLQRGWGKRPALGR